MLKKIKKFRKGENVSSKSFFDKLNDVVERVNGLSNLRLKVNGGKGRIIQSKKSQNIAITIPKEESSITNVSGGGGTSLVRFACSEDAPSGNVITANPYDSSGNEITSGTSGTDYNIPIWCNISNGEVAKIVHIIPDGVEVGDVFTVEVTADGVTDSISYTATDTNVSTVVSELTDLWNAETGQPFVDITATNNFSYMKLEADVAGEDYVINASTTNAGTQTLSKAVRGYPENVEIGDVFDVQIVAGGVTDSISFTATDTNVSTVVSELTTLWNNQTTTPFTNLTATDNTTYIALESDTYGYEYRIDFEATNGGSTNDQLFTKFVDLTPASIEEGDEFTIEMIEVGGTTDSITYVAEDETVSGVVTGLTELWNEQTSAPFTALTATDNSTYVTLQSDTYGFEYKITASTTDGGIKEVITDNSTFGNLDEATPRLNDGDELLAVKMTFSDGEKYVCTTVFNATADCICDT